MKRRPAPRPVELADTVFMRTPGGYVAGLVNRIIGHRAFVLLPKGHGVVMHARRGVPAAGENSAWINLRRYLEEWVLPEDICRPEILTRTARKDARRKLEMAQAAEISRNA